jgi:hypothetical protein
MQPWVVSTVLRAITAGYRLAFVIRQQKSSEDGDILLILTKNKLQHQRVFSESTSFHP